jgi:hypothetical protein
MATKEQRARRRAQRETAKRVKANRAKSASERITVIPKSFKKQARLANEAYARQVLAGNIPKPGQESQEGRMLARLASNARHGKADKRFSRFEEYWYHNKAQNFGAEAQTYEEGNMRDVDEGDEDE